MVKTAVIMGAGTGSRFGVYTQIKPKGFICVGGVPMIVKSIENILRVGIEKIIIGTGYQSSYYEELTKIYPQIVCCKSDKYAETNSMYTLHCCSELIANDDFLLLESDLIYERKSLSLLINSEYPDVMLITPPAKQQDGYYICTDNEGILSECTTDMDKKDKCKGELVGIHKLSNDTYQKMHDWYGNIWQQQPKLGYEYVLLEMARQGVKIHVLKEHIFWYEIDDESDLQYAGKNIIHYISQNEKLETNLGKSQ